MKRALMTPLTHYLRLWDYASSARVDEFIANSENVRRRILKTYRREASVIYPPVAVETFYSKPSDDYYLIVSELVAYKCIDRAVRVFARSGRKLKIAGDGPEFARLRRLATLNIEFCGRVNDQELRELFARCRAFLMPGRGRFRYRRGGSAGQRQTGDRPGARRRPRNRSSFRRNSLSRPLRRSSSFCHSSMGRSGGKSQHGRPTDLGSAIF